MISIAFSPDVASSQRRDASSTSGKPVVEVTQLQDSALRQIAALIAEKEARSPIQRKIDSQLLATMRMRRGDWTERGLPAIKTNVEVSNRGDVVVHVTTSKNQPVLEEIRRLGGKVLSEFAQYHSLIANVSLQDLESVAKIPEVRFIGIHPKSTTYRARRDRTRARSKRRERQPTASKSAPRLDSAETLTALIGRVTSEGDKTHQADQARATFGINGTGVKIGVISDSFNKLGGASADVATGDLPGPGNPNGFTTPVTVLEDCSEDATDEGRAMLQIIHDLAPGAQLYFATGFGSKESFAQNILKLRASGCDIIVDDVGYPDESPFQDGIIARAVNTVTSDGALYFSSAANNGNLRNNSSRTWEGDFVDVGPIPFGGRVFRGLHSFDGLPFNQVVDVGDKASVYLTWSDPLRAATNDYDLYVVDSAGTKILQRSTNPQDGAQDPFEWVVKLNAGERIVIQKTERSANRFLHLTVADCLLSKGTQGNTRGHSAAANAFTVAATPASFRDMGPPIGRSGPFPNSFGASSRVENFSSDGPRRVFFYSDGSPITPGNYSSSGGVVRQKPDITAADGVSTTFFGDESNRFFGTSAASPHAAAIAALLKSKYPSLSPAMIRTILTRTAIDIEVPGIDTVSGYGIVMARSALFWARYYSGEPAENSVDDGSSEVKASGASENGGIDVNRMTPGLYPTQLRTIRIFFEPAVGLPNPAGAQIRLIAFAGAAGTNRPPNNPTFLVNRLVSIPNVPPAGGWVHFPIDNGPVISSGDLYVGLQKPNPAGGVATFYDRNGNQLDRSFTSTNNGATWNPTLFQPSTPVNALIRAVFAKQGVTSVSAASYKETSLAPESVVAAFGNGL